MKIAVDFDGTIVEHKYPEIGEEYLFAIETLIELKKQKHDLILWTYRSGPELEQAVDYCRRRGLEFYAINRNYPEEVYDESFSRKINADLYIDDRNLGGFPGWRVVFEMVSSGKPFEPHYCNTPEPTKRGIFQKIKDLFRPKIKNWL